MKSACSSPIPWETLVAYFAADQSLEEEAALEEHMLGCASCTVEAEKVAAITEAIRTTLPPVVVSEDIRRLALRGVSMRENPVSPGQRSDAVFPPGVEVLLHRLEGIDLANAERVALRMRPEGSDQALLELPSVPFDRDARAVIVACSRHYAIFPPNIVVELEVRRTDGETTSLEYTLLHRY